MFHIPHKRRASVLRIAYYIIIIIVMIIIFGKYENYTHLPAIWSWQ